MTSLTPPNEPERLEALRRYHVLDTSAEEAFDELTRLAAQICGTPIALISLVDTNRQWFKSKVGLSVSETTREQSFCAHAILRPEMFIVSDAMADERFSSNPLVTADPNIRFYASAPLRTRDGHNIGTLCVIDRVPRELTEEQRESLRTIAHQAMMQLELRRHIEGLARLNQKLDEEIAERRRVEAEREQLLVREQQARTQAEEANHAKDAFLANVSHELRTPLTAMLGWIEMLRTGMIEDAGLDRALEIIERNAMAQSQLVEDLLDVSRIVSGKLRINVRPLDLHDVVAAAIEVVRPAADAKGIRITTALDPSEGLTAGDPDRLQQVVWNLLSNAVKFTPAGGTVEVRLERAGYDVEIAVSDTGAGITPEFLPFVFERFRQAEGALRGAGLGLGLAIVRHLVELHGGTVHAESAGEGRGATFRVRLPLTDTPPLAVAEERRHEAAAGSG